MIGEIRQIHYGKKYQGMPYQNRNGKVLRISNGNGPKNVLLQLRGKIQVVVPIGNLFEKNRFKADPMPRPWAETEYNDVDLFTGDNREDVERTIELFTDEEVNFVSSPAWSSQYVFEDRRERDAEWSEAADKIRDFGEGYLGDMHAQSDMSGLQRQIVEDCFNGSSGVQRPGLNMPSTPKHLRPEYVQERTGLSFQEADILIECWRTLEATPKMVMSFIRDIIAEPDRQWIEEWTTLSYEVAKVEQPPADYIAPQCETGFDDAVPIMYSRNLARRWEIDPDNFDDENGIDVMSFEPDDRHYGDSRPVVYETIGNDLGPDAWMNTQPEWLVVAIHKIKAVESLPVLARIAKFAMNDERLKTCNSYTRSVFWTQYKAKRTELKRRAFSAGDPAIRAELWQQIDPSRKEKATHNTRLIMKRIETTDKAGIIKAKSWLYELTKGFIAVKGWTPTKADANRLWQCLNKRKAKLGLA